MSFLSLLVTFWTLFLISEGIVIEHEIVIVGAIAQAEATHQVEGNIPIQLGSRLHPTNILAVKYKPISCKFTSFQRMHL